MLDLQLIRQSFADHASEDFNRMVLAANNRDTDGAGLDDRQSSPLGLTGEHDHVGHPVDGIHPQGREFTSRKTRMLIPADRKCDKDPLGDIFWQPLNQLMIGSQNSL